MASIQDPKGPLRLRDDDLVADTILERASDWTSSTQLLLALLKRHLMEMSLPLANQVLMAALKQHDHPNMDKWLEFLGKNGLKEVSFCSNFWSFGRETFGNGVKVAKIIANQSEAQFVTSSIIPKKTKVPKPRS